MISVIIPIYNTSEYLDRTISSVLSQSYSCFELLLIDDGSTDNSFEKCQYYASKDKRIRLIRQPNKGVSSARNLGLEAASGDWICFIDSDDELLPNALLTYHNEISDDIDVIRCGFERVKNGVPTHIHTDKKITDNKEKILSICIDSGYSGYLWNTCIRKSIIGDVRFVEDISWCEDHIFLYDIMQRSRQVSFLSDEVYRYYAPDSSLNNSAGNLSLMYKEPKMIMRGACMIHSIMGQYITNQNGTAASFVEKAIQDKANIALRYAIIGNRIFDMIAITHNYLNGNYKKMLKMFIRIKINVILNVIKTRLQ